MAFTKITDEQRLGKGNVGQPDTPLLTTTEMQEQMDSLPNLAIDGFNRLIDELSSTSAAQNIGMVTPPNVTAAPNVGAIINAMAVILTACNINKHIHANKILLDALTEEDVDNLHQFAETFSDIANVQHYLENDDTAIPTSAAVAYFVEHFNYKTAIRDAVYPVGAVYTTTGIDPDTLFGTSGKWSLLETDSNGVKFYRRNS